MQERATVFEEQVTQKALTVEQLVQLSLSRKNPEMHPVAVVALGQLAQGGDTEEQATQALPLR